MSASAPRVIGCVAVLFAVASCAEPSDGPNPGPNAVEAPVATAGSSRSADPSAVGAADGDAGPSLGHDGGSGAPRDRDAGAPEGAATTATPEGMVRIPAGMFLMGSPAFRGNAEEQPAHEAIVPSLFVDRTEVTVQAYRKCAAQGKCKPARSGHGFCNEKFTDRDDHPVNCIDWYDARDYCAFAGKRVPTEREWEYFAGGGAEHRPYSWGSEEPNQQIACYEHPFGSCKVGSFAKGAFGLHDVSGNVWEWTASAFKPYPSTDRGDEPSSTLRFFVYRGGSWSRRFPKWLRTTMRNRYEPDQFHASLGVRCVQTAEPLECPAQTEARDGVCVRTSGTPQCEPLFSWDGKQCKLAGSDGRAARAATDQFWRGGHAPPEDPSELGVPKTGTSATVVAGPAPEASADGKPTITRSRTPEHDADCARHWPSTPAAYLFQGGRFHDRKPIIAAAGCSPRDVGTSYTSACCAR